MVAFIAKFKEIENGHKLICNTFATLKNLLAIKG